MRGARDEPALANVCCALAIHAIIRANDALSMKYLGVKCTRHDDLADLFSKIAKGLPKGDGRFIELLAKVAIEKSGADYGKKEFNHADAEWYVENAEEFAGMARSRI